MVGNTMILAAQTEGLSRLFDLDFQLLADEPYKPVVSATACPNNIVEVTSDFAPGFLPTAAAACPAAIPWPTPGLLPRQRD